MRIVFLNRYQNNIERGAETFVKELAFRLSSKNTVDILSGKDADSVQKVLAGKYDIVIAVNGRWQSLKFSIARLIGRYKLLITGHSGIGRDDIWNITVARPDVFIALTSHMAGWARNWTWGTKVVKIPNGIDLEKFQLGGEKIDLKLEKPIILSVGALTWYKHQEKIISAMAKISRGSLLLVGKGEKKQELEAMGKELLGNRFRIDSFCYQDMPKVYRSCDLFSLPSWDREAFGIAYLEALASGLGVVAPNDASRREIIGNAGLFTNVDNPSEYAKSIDEALSIKWLEKARDQAAKFSWEEIAERYEDLMLNMIKLN